MEKYIDDNWKISSNFPAEYKTEVLCNEKNVICREVEFSYAPEKEQQTTENHGRVFISCSGYKRQMVSCLWV